MNTMPGLRCARTQVVAIDQLQPRHALEGEQHSLLVDGPGRDVNVATRAGGDVQLEARGLLPEPLVVKLRKPFFDVFPIGEFLHPGIVPERRRRMQTAMNR